MLKTSGGFLRHYASFAALVISRRQLDVSGIHLRSSFYRPASCCWLHCLQETLAWYTVSVHKVATIPWTLLIPKGLCLSWQLILPLWKRRKTFWPFQSLCCSQVLHSSIYQELLLSIGETFNKRNEKETTSWLENHHHQKPRYKKRTTSASLQACSAGWVRILRDCWWDISTQGNSAIFFFKIKIIWGNIYMYMAHKEKREGTHHSLQFNLYQCSFCLKRLF